MFGTRYRNPGVVPCHLLVDRSGQSEKQRQCHGEQKDAYGDYDCYGYERKSSEDD